LKLSVREALAGMRHDKFGDVYLAALKAFIDDSGSGGDSPWFVLAGYLGTANNGMNLNHPGVRSWMDRQSSNVSSIANLWIRYPMGSDSEHPEKK